jgi:hypothetical protein
MSAGSPGGQETSMNLDSMPIWAVFAAATIVVMVSIEVGYRLGQIAHRRSEDEKESPTSAFAGAVLGLVAFILAFTFGIVSNRYDARKALVREDANAIRTAFHRSDFLPETDREDAKRLLRDYLNVRLAFAQAGSLEPARLNELSTEVDRIQTRLWEMAVANARKDMNSDVAALYIESLNEVVDVHASRISLGVQERIVSGIWGVLAVLTILGMMGMGYHAGIAGSKRSTSMLILALSFALVIAMIASLDRPGGFLKITQQPLIDLKRSMTAEK